MGALVRRYLACLRWRPCPLRTPINTGRFTQIPLTDIYSIHETH